MLGAAANPLKEFQSLGRVEKDQVGGLPFYPREQGTLVNDAGFGPEGPRPFFPAVCLKTHWDPTMILRHTLPTQPVPQALDPRPWTKICLQYTTAGEDVVAPPIDPSTVMPTGGQTYPNSRYVAAINDESALRRLDRPLGTCDEEQYYPNPRGDMYVGQLLVPKSAAVSARVAETAFPKALMSSGPYPCRYENDVKNMGISDRLFNNATKQDKYKLKAEVDAKAHTR